MGHNLDVDAITIVLIAKRIPVLQRVDYWVLCHDPKPILRWRLYLYYGLGESYTLLSPRQNMAKTVMAVGRVSFQQLS